MKIVYKLTMEFLIISILMGFVAYNGYIGAISIKNQYAFPEGRNGTIKIAFKRIGSNMFQLSISDDGIGIPRDMDIRNTKSLGLHLVTALAENQLHGELILNRDRKTEFQINFKGV